MGLRYGSSGPESGVRGLALVTLAFAALGSPPAATASSESAGATTDPSTSLTGTPIRAPRAVECRSFILEVRREQ